MLSRYHDVLEAFRETRLWPVGSRGEDQGGGARDSAGVLAQRTAVQDALSASRIAEWQTQVAALAGDLLRGLPTDRPVDLLEHFAMPWCLRLGLIVTGASPGDRIRLGTLAARAFAGTGAPRRAFLRRHRATAAVTELKHCFEAATMPLAQATFVGIVQTLPRLLASGWLALFQHPAEVARLRANPTLMPRAVEELLRYAGIIPRLYRKASADVELASVTLKAGERATLMVALANRDPERFPEPDRLDVSRPATGQLSLGIGHGSCAGARIVRMALGVSITTILGTFRRIDAAGGVAWRTGIFCWPQAVPVTVRQ